MKKILVGFFLLCCYSVPSANALTITVNDNIADNTYLTAGSTLKGSFNINAAVPGGGQYLLPYGVSSATAAFRLTDDLSALSKQSPVVGDYQEYQKINNDTWYRRYRTTWFLDQYEQVQLDIAGQISSDGTTWYELPITPVGNQTLDSTTNNGTPHNPKYDYFYTQNATGQHGYTGTVNLTEVLGTDGLTDLSADGILPFSLTMLQGGLTLESGTLTAELSPNPVIAAAVTNGPAPVPEPGTIVLVGLGLLGLGAYGRNRKRN